MTSNQETPRNSATPANHNPSRSSVAPTQPNALPPSPPIRSPSRPPAVSAPFCTPYGDQLSVASPQLVTRVRMNPAIRRAVLMRMRGSGMNFSLCTSQPA